MHALLLRLIRESDRVPVEEAERSTYDPRLGKHKSGKHHECDHPDGWAEVPFPECLAHRVEGRPEARQRQGTYRRLIYRLFFTRPFLPDAPRSLWPNWAWAYVEVVAAGSRDCLLGR